jgi:hypothetical protein
MRSADLRRVGRKVAVCNLAGKKGFIVVGEYGNLRAGVGVHLALATSKSNVDETAGVCKSLLRAALRSLLLLLLLDLGGLRLDLSSTSQTSVNLAHFQLC